MCNHHVWLLFQDGRIGSKTFKQQHHVLKQLIVQQLQLLKPKLTPS